MVITRVKNETPDMSPTAFDGKFDEKKDEIPPGICRPHTLQNIQIGHLRVDIKQENGHKCDHRGSPWVRTCMYLSTILSKVFLHPKDPNFN